MDLIIEENKEDSTRSQENIKEDSEIIHILKTIQE